MGKHTAARPPEKRGARKRRRPLAILLIVVVVLLAALVAAALLAPEEWLEPTPLSTPGAESPQATAEPLATEAEPGTVSHGVGLPYALDGGNLMALSLFPSSVSNPDCGEEPGEDLASLEVQNTSGRYLTRAEIELRLQSGETLRFVIEDLPAGKTVWAFDTANTPLAADAVCQAITCTADYAAEPPLAPDVLEITAEGTLVTLRNLTEEDLPGAEISFRCLFDEALSLYYGGRTWMYASGPIPAGGSVTLDVYECYLGTAEAVRVSLNG